MPVNLGPWTSRPAFADWAGSAAGKFGPGLRYPAGPDPLASLLSAGTMRELLSARLANRVGTGLPVVRAPQPAPVDTLSLSGAAQARIVDARPVATQEPAPRPAARSPAPASDAGEAYRELGRRADILRAWQAASASPLDRGREARGATPGSASPTGVSDGIQAPPSPGVSSGGPATGPGSSEAAGAGSPPTGEPSAGPPSVENGSVTPGSTTSGGSTAGGAGGSGAATGDAGSNGSTAGSGSSGSTSGSGTGDSSSTGSTSGSGTGGSGSSAGSGGLLGLLFKR